MKKIISIICVLAMMFSFAITVNAADKQVTFELVEQTADYATYNVVIESADIISGITTYFDAADAAAKNATVQVTAVSATMAKYQRNTIIANFAPTDGSTVTGKVVLATVKFTNVTEAFTIAAVSASGKMFGVTIKDPQGGADLDATANYTHAANVTVAPYVAEETIAYAAVNAEDTFTTADGKTKYINVAVMPVNFTLDSAKGTAKALKLDIMKGDATLHTYTWDNTSIAGDGSVDYVVTIYPVTDGSAYKAVPSTTYSK